MKRTIKFILVYFLFAILVTGCSTVSTLPEAPAKQISWKDREARLSRINSWKLSGKIAVETAKDSGSATVDWSQQRQQFTISLLGPLGSGGLTLNGRPGLVTLQSSDGKTYQASNAQELLARTWGWNLPVSYLNYWIRGLPVPGISQQSQFDPYQRLSLLVQQGWQVQYLSYTNVGSVDLPSKITITSNQLKTKIVVYDWQV